MFVCLFVTTLCVVQSIYTELAKLYSQKVIFRLANLAALLTSTLPKMRYDAVNAMLLNEFLKEHCKAGQLTKDFESQLVEEQKQIEALTAGLQKVSDQLELSKPVPQIIVDKQGSRLPLRTSQPSNPPRSRLSGRRL